MKRVVILSSIVATFVFSAELQWGHGTIDLKGGFIGLDQTISDDIDTYSLVEVHKNILNSNWFYSYDITLLDSKKIKQLQKNYNTGASAANSVLNKLGVKDSYITIPELEYRVAGADVGLALGYDILHKSKSDYLGVGLYTGLSVPYIKSSKSATKTVSANIDVAKYFKDSKTEFLTYKIGVGVYAQKSLNDMVSIYGNSAYAYQRANITNDYIKADFDVDGSYFEAGAGLKFHVIKADAGILSPRLYGTIGWKYRKWKVDDVALNISGISALKTPKSDMEFSTNTFTVGIGYSF